MDALFLVVALVFLLLLVLGLVRPAWVVHWGASRTRAQAALVYGLGLVLALVLFRYELTAPGSADMVRPPAAWVGAWSGRTAAVMLGTQQGELPLELRVAPNGEVEGRIGDATVERGGVWRIPLTRRWLGDRAYVLDLLLRGRLADGAVTERVRIELESREGSLVGTLRCRLAAGGADGGRIEVPATLSRR